MSDSSLVIRVKKFCTNPLLMRKQFCLEVHHPNRGQVSKAEIAEKLAKMYKTQDVNCVFLFGFKTAFGGGRSSGFGIIYDNINAAKKYAKKYLLVRNGVIEAVKKTGRRGTKELKNRKKKVRGKEKTKVAGGKKK